MLSTKYPDICGTNQTPQIPGALSPENIRLLRTALEQDYGRRVPLSDEQVGRMARDTLQLIALILCIAKKHNIEL